MIDALLLAVKDVLIEAPFGWDKLNCDVMGDGHPPPKNAKWFCAIHQDGERGDMLNALDEYYSFAITVTRTLDGIPKDRVSNGLLNDRLARTLAQETGLNSRVQQLKTFLHMNWAVIARANVLLAEMYALAHVVNGFAEPMHWEQNMVPKFVGGEWLEADPNQPDVALAIEMRFRDARRLQPIAEFV